MDWIHLAPARDSCENDSEPSSSIKYWKILE
jgi:hypothetical protein